MLTVIDIWNAALSTVGAHGRLSSLTENSREREECELWYPFVLETVQSAAYWPGCQAVDYLGLVKERNTSADWVNSDPRPQFIYKYSVPSEMLRPWYLVDFSRFSMDSDITTGEPTIACNLQNAVLVYARKQETVTYWTPDQRLATIHGLAAHLAIALSGNRGMMQDEFEKANRILMNAQAMASNDQNLMEYETVPPQILARGAGYGSSAVRYTYPLGELFTEAML